MDGKVLVQLFGGAFTAYMPANRVDVSDLREVPDNQEVFAHPTTDQSLIIEIMEFCDSKDDRAALRTFSEDLSLSNGCQSDMTNVVYNELDKSSLSLSQCSSCQVLTGTQAISKFKDNAKNNVQISMALLRLPSYDTDILVTFNNPIFINPESSSHDADSSSSASAWTHHDFISVVQTLTLIDDSIFG